MLQGGLRCHFESFTSGSVGTLVGILPVWEMATFVPIDPLVRKLSVVVQLKCDFAQSYMERMLALHNIRE